MQLAHLDMSHEMKKYNEVTKRIFFEVAVAQPLKLVWQCQLVG